MESSVGNLAVANVWSVIFSALRSPQASSRRRPQSSVSLTDYVENFIDPFWASVSRLFKQGHLNKLIAKIEVFLVDNPRSRVASALYAALLLEVRENERALNYSNDVISSQRSAIPHAEVWAHQTIKLVRGAALVRLQRFEEAKDFLNRVKPLNDEKHFQIDVILYSFRGIAKFHADDLPGAEEDLRCCYGISKDDFWSVYYLARIALNKDDEETAIGFLTEAIALNSNSASSYHLRGLAYLALKKIDFALLDIQKANELAPSDIEIVGNLAYVLVTHDRYAEALPHAIEACTKNENEENIAVHIAALAGIGHLQEAIHLFNYYGAYHSSAWNKSGVMIIEDCYNIYVNSLKGGDPSKDVSPRYYHNGVDLTINLPTQEQESVGNVSRKRKSPAEQLSFHLAQAQALAPQVRPEIVRTLEIIRFSPHEQPEGLGPRALPPSTPERLPPSMRRVADLTPEEHEARRLREREKKRKQKLASMSPNRRKGRHPKQNNSPKGMS